MGSKYWVGWGLLALAGCGGGDKGPNAPTCPPGQVFDGQLCRAQQTAQPPADQGGAGSATGGNGSTTPPVVPTGPIATTKCEQPAPTIDVSAAQAVTGALLPLAAQKAMPGAKALGAPVAAQLQQGQCVETTITMSPGKCYSVVATGLPTLQNLDLALVPAIAMPGLPLAVVAADNSVGPTAVLGENPNCFKWAVPMVGTMKLIVTAAAGQGLVAAQVFEK